MAMPYRMRRDGSTSEAWKAGNQEEGEVVEPTLGKAKGLDMERRGGGEERGLEGEAVSSDGVRSGR